jgi:hypothetical protein
VKTKLAIALLSFIVGWVLRYRSIRRYYLLMRRSDFDVDDIRRDDMGDP